MLEITKAAFRAPSATMVSAVQFVTLLLSFGEKEATKMTKNPKSLQSLSLCEHVTLHQWSSAAGYILDPEYGDITDTLEGTDISLVYTKPTTPGAYPQTSLKMRRNTSALLEDTEAIPALLDGIPDIDSLFERLTPEQIDAILDEQLASGASDELMATK